MTATEPRVEHPTSATADLSPDQIPQLLDRATIAMESLRSQWRTMAGLGTHERMAVSQLRVYGPMPMSELAARISLSRAAVTSLVDRLASSNWIERRNDPTDRRRTLLSLLPRASSEYDAVSGSFQAELSRWATSMPAEEWDQVSEMITRFSELAEREASHLRATATERALL